MIQPQTVVEIADNSGGKRGRVFKILGGSKRRYARLGDTVVLSVIVADSAKTNQVKKKDVVRGVVVRQRAAYRRKDGSYIRFDQNAVVVVDSKKKEPRCTRVFGPVAREIASAGYNQVTSLAPKVL